jgi:hypothetical protein
MRCRGRYGASGVEWHIIIMGWSSPPTRSRGQRSANFFEVDHPMSTIAIIDL